MIVEAPWEGSVELVLYHPTRPKHLGISEVRIGKRCVSSVLGTDKDVAFVLKNNINICGIKRYHLQRLPYLLDPFLHPPERYVHFYFMFSGACPNYYFHTWPALKELDAIIVRRENWRRTHYDNILDQ